VTDASSRRLEPPRPPPAIRAGTAPPVPGSGRSLALDAARTITVSYALSGLITRHLLEASIDRAMLDPYVARGPNVPGHPLS
jgi:hypothetical protein